MAFQVLDRVQETTTTTGTGTVTLGGAVSGFQSFFNAGLNNGDTTYYCVTSGTAWEVGLGTFSTGPNAIARTTILASSASGSAITLAGTSNIFCVYPAGKSVYLDASGNVAGYNLTAGTINSTTVGATTASTGAFTTLSASSTVSGTGFSTYLASPPAIGGTAAAAGTFTTLIANTSAGVGAIAPAGINFYNVKSITGATTANASVVSATVQSDVTSQARGYSSVIGTAAAAFTLSNLRHFYANQGTIGAGSTVTNQAGFLSENNLIGATNNYAFSAGDTAAITTGNTAYGFFSSVNIATGGGTTYAFYAQGTAPNVFTGTVNIGNTGSAGNNFTNAKNITGATTANASVVSATVQSDVTSQARGYSSVIGTAAAAFTLSNLRHFYANQGTIGAGSTVTAQTGYYSETNLIGATNNYAFLAGDTAPVNSPNTAFGFYSAVNIPTGTGVTWGFYAAGTANNVLRGNTYFGNTATPTAKIHVAAGTATAGTAPLKFTAGTNLTTAEAGAMEYDGKVPYFSGEASQPGVVNASQFVILTSDYTTPAGTANVLKQAFNATTNGTLTLTTGTYLFKCLLAISAMSSTAGTLAFGFGGTVSARFRYVANANKIAVGTGGAPNTTFANVMTATVLTASNTTTTGYALIEGSIAVVVGGTLIPSIALSVAAACVVATGSYFILTPIGSSTATTVGNWS